MFTAEDQVSQSVYKLDGMAAKTFSAVLEFIYSANVSVDQSSSEQLLDMARFLDIRDLLKAHEDLQKDTSKAENVTSAEGDSVDECMQTKRKRGRPKKSIHTQDSSQKENPESDLPAETTSEPSEPLLDPTSPSRDVSDSDYNPREDRPRHSKRKIKQPVKLKGYRLGDEVTEHKEPGKRGRKRKYPDTEARGEKPYVCNICDKTFSDQSARRRHVASHTGKKPFTCYICNLSFARMDNLKAHTKTHNKERQQGEAETTGPAPVEATSAPEEMHSILQLQPYQLPTHPEQEIQLVVTGEVDNINLGQDQSISIITAEDTSVEQGLTLLTQPSGHVQNLALVTPDGLDASTQIQTISVLGSQVSGGQPEQMHVITLTKEAMEQLQVHHGGPQQLQVIHQLSESSAENPSRTNPAGGIHISSQSGQPISISQTSEQIPSDQIQGQTFQIQAGTVSYLYTTSMTPQN
ncbi:zinc finger and BTB domain-containing 24 [Labeo rohita]|nr:zinc finger and BTB domain-containing 24 [Labeo rohita]